MSRELQLKSELSSKEINLQLKIDKKKVFINELLEQKKDLENVSKELYSELQNALLVTQRLEKDNESLHDLIDEYRAGDACVPVLQEKLQIEMEKNQKLKEQIQLLHHDIQLLQKYCTENELKYQQLQYQHLELQENTQQLEYQLGQHINRSNLLISDNLNLENKTKLFKEQIMKLNDHIVDIKGSICVYCRVRPLFSDELKLLNLTISDIESLIHYPDYNIIDYNSIPYEFHRVFEPNLMNDDIYEEIESYVRSVINGCRLCVFM